MNVAVTCDAEKKLAPRACKTCGFTTDNPLVTLCPRCASSMPLPASCSGGCTGCHAK